MISYSPGIKGSRVHKQIEVKMSALAPRRSQTEVNFTEAAQVTPSLASAQGELQASAAPSALTTTLSTHGAAPALANPAKTECEVQNVRLSFDTVASAKELANGTAIARLNDPLAIFQSNSDITEEQLQHAIVTGIVVNSISSDCPEAVMMSLKLFENDKIGQIQNSSIGITNEHGWLYSNNSDDFGAGTSSAAGGYSNMLSIFPYERSRPCTKVYDPSGVRNNRFIETYGGFNGDQLWDNIIAFPRENFYFVHKNHVVMSVISQNWDSLGINPAEEVLHENKYYKLSSALVDHVVNKLKNDVLSTIPFTDLTNLQVKYTSKNKSLWSEQPSMDEKYKIITELKISYMFPNSNA